MKVYLDVWIVYDRRDNTIIAEGTEEECNDYAKKSWYYSIMRKKEK